MTLHRLAVWLLAVNLLLGALVVAEAAGAAAPEAGVAAVETSPYYSQPAPRARLLPKPGLYSSAQRCLCVLPHLQKVWLEPAASPVVVGALRPDVVERSGLG
jgi:hypothetical protein